MPGKKDEFDAVSSFFGDDDEWLLDEDSDVIERAPEVEAAVAEAAARAVRPPEAPDAAVVEPAPAAPPTAEPEPAPAGQPEPTEVVSNAFVTPFLVPPESSLPPTPALPEADAPRPVSVHRMSVTQPGLAEAPAPPPFAPPRFDGAGRTSVAPRPLDPSTDDVAATEPVRPSLPTPPELWREFVDAAVAEGGPASMEAVARVRLLRLGDLGGAAAALDQAGDDADPRGELRRAITVGEQAAAAWGAWALAHHGGVSADAWRRVASLRQGEERLDALQRAVETDPHDVLSWEQALLLASTREARVPLLEGLADAVGGAARVAYDLTRAHNLLRTGAPEVAAEAVRSAAAADPAHPGVLALAEGLGLAIDGVPVPEEPAVPGWIAWRAAASGPGTADAWRAAIRAGGLDPAAAWWASLRSDPGALGEAVRDGLEALGDRVPGALRFLAGLAFLRADRAADALGVLDAAAFTPCALLLAPIESAQPMPDAVRDVLEARAAAGEPAALAALARATETDLPGSDEAAIAWERALRAGAEVAGEAARAARRAGRVDLLVAALRARIGPVIDTPRKAAWAAELAFLLRDALGRPEDVAAAVEQLDGSLAELTIELRATAAIAAGRLDEAAAVWLDAAGRAVHPDAVSRRFDAALLLLETDPARGAEVIAALDEDAPGRPEVHAAAVRASGVHGGAALRAALLRDPGAEASTAAWLIGWLDGADAPVPDEAVARHALLALRAAIAPSSRERAARWGAASGGGMLRLAARVDAIVDEDQDRAAAWLSDAREDASPALARLAWRAGRLDLARALSASADLPARTRAWVDLDAAQEPAAVRAVFDKLPDAASAEGAAWLGVLAAVAAHPEADDALRRDAWRRILGSTASAPLKAACAARLAADAPAEEAAAWWREVLTHRPYAGDAFEIVRGDALDRRDADAVRSLHARHRPDDVLALAEALDLAGSPDPSLWSTLAEGGDRYAQAALHVALLRTESYKALFDAWTSEIASATGPLRDRLEARRRWLLVNRLADSDDAWEVFEALHREDPEDRAVRANLARIAGARGDLDLALSHLEALRASAGDPTEKAATYHAIAEVYERAGRDDDARKAWLDALDAQPEDLEALAGLRALAERREQWDEVEAVLQRQSRIGGRGARLDALRALALLCEGPVADPPRALETWARVLAEIPDDQQALEATWTLACAAGDDDAAIRAGTALVGVFAGTARRAMREAVGARCEAAGRTAQAIALYERGLDEDPPDPHAADRLAALAEARADHGALVRALVARARATDGRSAAAAFLVRAASVELNHRFDRDAAHQRFDEALRLDPDQPDALRFEATWLFDAARYDESLDVHQRLVPILEAEDLDEPDTRVEVTSFYFRFGTLLAMRGDRDGARVRWERGLQLNPSHLPTLRSLGPVVADREDWDRVGAVYTRLLELTGGQGEPLEVATLYAMLGRVDLAAGHFAKARKRLHKALEVRAGFVPALRGIAALEEAEGRWQQALLIYNEVINNASPDDEEDVIVEAYLTKGRLLDDHLGRADKAREHYAGCLSYTAGEPRALARMMELALREGDWEQAISLADEALAHASDDPLRATLWLGLAIARSALEDDAGAREALGRARGRDSVLDDVDAADVDAARAAVRARLPR